VPLRSSILWSKRSALLHNLVLGEPTIRSEPYVLGWVCAASVPMEEDLLTTRSPTFNVETQGRLPHSRLRQRWNDSGPHGNGDLPIEWRDREN